MNSNNVLPPAKSKIGIWGFGVVGKSVLSFLTNLQGKDYQLSLIDKRELTPLEKELVKGHNVQFIDQAFLPQFLEFNDYVIASPGIDLEPYKDYQNKWLTELDLFSTINTVPVIGVTGSVGKTSVVTLLTGLLNAFGKRAYAIGNIGTPMLDLLTDQHNTYDYYVMELSSFQLEHAKHFKPHIAIITNLIANHLDRHKTLENYLYAKSIILKNQTEEDYAIIPMEFMDAFWPFIGTQKVIWVGEHSFEDITKILSDITCTQNWNLILTTLELLDVPLEDMQKYAHTIKMPRHRVEFLGTYNGIKFYNDSKATVIQSTQQALNRFKNQSILLFLGGLSKGADRKPLIDELPTNIKHVFCFGKEADQLAKWCTEAVINSSTHTTLESAFKSCIEIMDSNDIVLLSPSGSSYDLFNHYEERGDVFKKLFEQLRLK